MPMFGEPPDYLDPTKDPWMTKILIAGAMSRHRGTYELACIIAGRKDLIPCVGCDYPPSGCRCYDAGKGTQ